MRVQLAVQTNQILDFIVIPPIIGDSETRVVNFMDRNLYMCDYCKRPGVTKIEHQHSNWLKLLKFCSNCGKARYCGKNCQKKAWRQHKVTCRIVKPNFTVSSQDGINIQPTLAPTMSYHSEETEDEITFVDQVHESESQMD